MGERSYCISGNTVDRVTYQNGTGVRESGSFTVNTVDRHAVAYSINPLDSNSMKSANPNSGFNETKVSQTLDCFKQSGSGGTLKGSGGAVGYGGESLVAEKMVRWIVRRLTPTECERLQGLPDGWTDIGEWIDTKGRVHKPADTPRYKALGNSIALPQWFWIVQKMRPYIGDGATMGSLFDGIGGFPLVWEATYGKGTARWASEIEEFPIAVTKKWFGSEEAKL